MDSAFADDRGRGHMSADNRLIILPSDHEREVGPAWTPPVESRQEAKTARRREVERLLFIDLEDLSEQVDFLSPALVCPIPSKVGMVCPPSQYR